MMDSIYSGISGLNAAQQALNSQTNNISNINTVAYKADTISFADLMYQDGKGKGTTSIAIEKNFVQGELKVTDNPYDFAIKGDGFFNVYDSELDKNYYTRAGNFKMGVDGLLKMPTGQVVMGLTIDQPAVVSTNPAITKFSDEYGRFLATETISTRDISKTINTAATDYMKTATTSGVSGTNYKTDSAKVRDVDTIAAAYNNALSLYSTNPIEGTAATVQVSTVSYGTTPLVDGDYVDLYIDGVSYGVSFNDDSTSTYNTLADNISNADGLTSSYNPATGELLIESLIPGKSLTLTGTAINGKGVNVETIEAQRGEGYAAVTSIRDALKTAVEAAGAEFLELTTSADLTKQNNLELTQLQLQLDKLNISSINPFGELSVDDGNLYMTQGNHQFLVGKVVTSIFKDNKSLDPKGENLYEKTVATGEPLYAYGVNKIENNILELSNSNFGESLVTMMSLQRAFEGSSKSLTTSDELLRTAIQMKK